MTVCLHNEISGGKKLRAKTRKSNSRAAKAFRLAAQSLAHSDSALGDFYRCMRAKFGPSKAITATAPKLACQENRLKTNARKLGFERVPIQQSAEIFA